MRPPLSALSLLKWGSRRSAWWWWFAEIAENFRTQGNDLFKRRKFRDAIGFYTRALDEVGRELPVEERRTLRCNRAAANLELCAFPLSSPLRISFAFS